MLETSDIFNILHNAVEAKNMGKKISHAVMAKKLGVSMRTYQDWRLGTTKPQAATAICQMLCELDSDEASFVLHKIKKLLGD
ncbi:XRE family transcriptional regulator [Campylobacter sp. JMF_01 NE2]|uniref:XRE family transcriptional regulator n=1 Tax=unclassified Campylobacter TaxID=2593542 RepID=UPI001B5C0E2E|nr:MULTISPECIES: XRE family transcriptional regulator [unclassified Campylobacter]MBP3224441.1 XRE family transcriptional regulator [Campylobacter sp.]MDA3042911.1 XRE family transcriptional regulator [Campylobacter sp. JMF_09 ED2]MDA3044254.1 XRE family transcriptional regulator [Campylobacter sp. JMF_07 ED4]MDA3046678.1 XRE family transcriptional regulator [Campylobacter sp. VBCF_06 NA8]MDA3047719.1 XRE family transcriptional regulator [Campylobacter sp. JMF_08 NE1]